MPMDMLAGYEVDLDLKLQVSPGASYITLLDAHISSLTVVDLHSKFIINQKQSPKQVLKVDFTPHLNNRLTAVVSTHRVMNRKTALIVST